MSSAPRVSVVIPVYNLREFVGEAIGSVLAQTLPPEAIEIVVVDDGSTDASGDVAASYGPRVRVLRQANRGLPAARNAGVRATGAPVVAFLDADDRVHPDKLALQLAVLDARPDVDVVTCGVRGIDVHGAPLPPQGWARLDGDVFARLLLGNVGPPHALLLRRAVIEGAGGFDETLTAAEDWDLWLRIARRGARWATVDRALADYRIRPASMHQDPTRMATNCRRVLDKAFADPSLPPAIRALAVQAYQEADLVAACDYYRVGEREQGARLFRTAVTARPTMLAEPRTLRHLCQLLLPVGYRSQAMVIARRRDVLPVLRTMLVDLFAAPALERAVAAQRRRAWLAYWLVFGRCLWLGTGR
ncbi:MAG: glycosyltransferase [Candidatus Binatia bacterium]